MGRYPPGSRLIETKIARELGVSQAPVREALRDLESVGVVESLAFRGTRVRKPTVAELVEAFPVRAVLESLAAREAARRISEEQLVELERLIDPMVEAAHRRAAASQSVANAQFHGLVVHAAGNATLERQWLLLEPFARTYLTTSHPGIDLVRLAERHRKICHAPRDRDSEAGAAAAMHDHPHGGLAVASRGRAMPRGRGRSPNSAASSSHADLHAEALDLDDVGGGSRQLFGTPYPMRIDPPPGHLIR